MPKLDLLFGTVWKIYGRSELPPPPLGKFVIVNSLVVRGLIFHLTSKFQDNSGNIFGFIEMEGGEGAFEALSNFSGPFSFKEKLTSL